MPPRERERLNERERGRERDSLSRAHTAAVSIPRPPFPDARCVFCCLARRDVNSPVMAENRAPRWACFFVGLVRGAFIGVGTCLLDGGGGFSGFLGRDIEIVVTKWNFMELLRCC